MKQVLITFLLCAALIPSATAQKLQGMQEETSPAATDILYLVIDPATAPADRKLTLQTLAEYLPSLKVAGGVLTVSGGRVGVLDATPDSPLALDVEGKAGASEFCNADGSVCFTAASVLVTGDVGSTVQPYNANTTTLGNITTGTGGIVRNLSPSITTPTLTAPVVNSGITSAGDVGITPAVDANLDVTLSGEGTLHVKDAGGNTLFVIRTGPPTVDPCPSSVAFGCTNEENGRDPGATPGGG